MIDYITLTYFFAYKKRGFAMTAKKKIIQAVEALSPDTTFEEAMERLLFLAKVDKGIDQADAGETISHKEVKERMSKWLK
jgi:predicted transcriptional regulator